MGVRVVQEIECCERDAGCGRGRWVSLHLGSVHALCTRCFLQLPRCLDDDAARAEEGVDEVHAEGAVYAAHLARLGATLRHEPPAQAVDEEGGATEAAAALARVLGVVPGQDARAEVSLQAHAAVPEAAEQPVGPVPSHGRSR